MAKDSVRHLAAVLAAAALVAVARGGNSNNNNNNNPLTTDSDCQCYKTNGTAASYFSHHRFFDFGSLHRYVNVTKPIDDFRANAEAPPTSSYFLRPEFADTWDIQRWDNTELMALNDETINDATIKMVNSPNNIYIEHDDDDDDDDDGQATHLTLRTVRHAAGFQSAAEIESLSKGFRYLSVRMRARTRGARGAVTAMFTYRDPPPGQGQGPDDDYVAQTQEADLEILTREDEPPTRVQYTNQPSWDEAGDIPEATRNVTLPRGRRWTDWVDYRMDWTPGSSTWYVDGQPAARITFQAPRDPLQVIFNAWSDGGTWSGRMPVGAEAFLQIKWIEIVYNTTDKHPGSSGGGGKAKEEEDAEPEAGCRKVCSIDETSRIGTPVLLSAGTSAVAVSALPWLSALLTVCACFMLC
ncbi:glycoside hydrolase family 16 protein [Thermothelomyces thermophilus ATCC 42464]|uniref:Glycoside hydrolase family 16 protein n=1 Tax=Thermothelomyces thermophilus (strain ATCC 42464 / BCRC 31852 / DSM 1799) TaxID=573729 RepID=G2Q075_THET4|nr:glycoside hydrolase family 16 protein [Thermothelomyces thermophilus ATCC 42464]AEO55749.1 glycoside hydrolase family 16 protein [Thermothelomyces thermophilus ATCC 42464]